jgi:CheY-like chemotaxis protein
VEDGKKVILAVDDDPDVREIAVLTLEMQGYVVVEAADAATALDLLEVRPGIDVLFTDIVMPGMNGFELAHLAKQKRPDVKVVYTSGFTRELPWGKHGVGYGPLIEKPWKAPDLGEQIARVFEE